MLTVLLPCGDNDQGQVNGRRYQDTSTDSTNLISAYLLVPEGPNSDSQGGSAVPRKLDIDR